MPGTRKRAPGGGRKPQGPAAGNTATITVRVRPEIRAELDRERKRNRVSLSQEIQRRLAASLDTAGRRRLDRLFGWTDEETRRNRALASLVGQLAARIESTTGASWRADRFTFDALAAGVGILLDSMAPAGAAVIPDRVRDDAARLGKRGDQLKEPEGVAAMIALGLMDQLRRAELPPADHPETDHYAEHYYEFPKIRQALKLNGDEK